MRAIMNKQGEWLALGRFGDGSAPGKSIVACPGPLAVVGPPTIPAAGLPGPCDGSGKACDGAGGPDDMVYPKATPPATEAGILVATIPGMPHPLVINLWDASSAKTNPDNACIHVGQRGWHHAKSMKTNPDNECMKTKPCESRDENR
jgi:hypothetical protein